MNAPAKEKPLTAAEIHALELQFHVTTLRNMLEKLNRLMDQDRKRFAYSCEERRDKENFTVRMPHDLAQILLPLLTEAGIDHSPKKLKACTGIADSPVISLPADTLTTQKIDMVLNALDVIIKPKAQAASIAKLSAAIDQLVQEFPASELPGAFQKALAGATSFQENAPQTHKALLGKFTGAENKRG